MKNEDDPRKGLAGSIDRTFTLLNGQTLDLMVFYVYREREDDGTDLDEPYACITDAFTQEYERVDVGLISFADTEWLVEAAKADGARGIKVYDFARRSEK